MPRLTALALSVALAATLIVPLARSEDDPMTHPPMDPAQQAHVRKMTTPGPEHAAMAWYLGRWDVKFTLVMPGQDGKPMAQPMGAGTAEFSWAIDGRWMLQEVDGQMMGGPYRYVSIHGYENHRKDFVTVSVNNHDTALSLFRGVVVDPTGKVNVSYGTIYEYLDGTYDKPVKTVIERGESDDAFTLVVWDLQIGPNGAPVLRFDYTRKR
jgi:hypothetical protein